MNKIIFNITALVVLAAGFTSCLKKETYPVIPAIEYKSFTALSADKALLVFTFTDGDGDIGLKPTENLNDSLYYYNLYIQTYYKNYQGIFKDTTIYYQSSYVVHVPKPYPNGHDSTVYTTKVDTGLIRQRIQYITNNNKDKALKGEIYVDLNGYRQRSFHKIIKYKFWMYDRSKNKSNVVETPELVIPY